MEKLNLSEIKSKQSENTQIIPEKLIADATNINELIGTIVLDNIQIESGEKTYSASDLIELIKTVRDDNANITRIPRKYGLREKIIELTEKNSEEISNVDKLIKECNSIDELCNFIEENKLSVKGGHREYSPAEIISLIRDCADGKENILKLTRAYGIRFKVMELQEKKT